MNADVKVQWIAALRSGEYVQGKRALHSRNNTFCCLGVLCDLHRKITGEGEWRFGSLNKMDYARTSTASLDHDESLLPSFVEEWAGLTSTNPRTMERHHGDRCLASLNDGGYTFAQIADIIERDL